MKVQLIAVAFSVIVTVPCYRMNSSHRNSAVAEVKFELWLLPTVQLDDESRSSFRNRVFCSDKGPSPRSPETLRRSSTSRTADKRKTHPLDHLFVIFWLFLIMCKTKQFQT